MENDTMIFFVKLGKKLAEHRKKNGFSQRQLAKKLKISQQLLAAYELGQRRLHAFLLFKLSKILSVSVDDLLGLQKNQQSLSKK
jgi:transcriptional regulator with XRE-family HTH domain